MDGKCKPKRILESNNIGRRPVGKPRKRWVNAVKIDSGDSPKEKLGGESLNRQV
jgi:hypothetical protein